MKYSIIITVLTTLLTGLFQWLFMLVRSGDYFYYSFILTLVLFTVPILGSVILYKYVFPKFFKKGNSFFILLTKAVLIFFMIQCSLVCWALADMQFLDFNYTYTLSNIFLQYKEVYADFLLASLLVPVLIIYLSRLYSKLFPGIYNQHKCPSYIN